MLGEHELNELSDETVGVHFGARLRATYVHKLFVGNRRLVADAFEVAAKRVEVLEAFIELEREHDAGVHIVPRCAKQARKILRGGTIR